MQVKVNYLDIKLNTATNIFALHHSKINASIYRKAMLHNFD